jgi:hypothetical protein
VATAFHTGTTQKVPANSELNSVQNNYWKSPSNREDFSFYPSELLESELRSTRRERASEFTGNNKPEKLIINNHPPLRALRPVPQPHTRTHTRLLQRRRQRSTTARLYLSDSQHSRCAAHGVNPSPPLQSKCMKRTKKPRACCLS